MADSGWWQQRPQMEKSKGFPYYALRAFGVVFIFLGIILFGFGVAMWAYSEVKYGLWCTLPNILNDCNDPRINFTRVAAAVAALGGLLLLIAGAVALSLYKRSPSSLKSRRNGFAAVVALLAILLLPCAIALGAVELIRANCCASGSNTNEAFFVLAPDGSLKLIDPWKFVFPVIIIGIAFIAWVLCLAALILICVRGAIKDKSQQKYATFRDDMADPRRPHVPMPMPGPGPMMEAPPPAIHHHYHTNEMPPEDLGPPFNMYPAPAGSYNYPAIMGF